MKPLDLEPQVWRWRCLQTLTVRWLTDTQVTRPKIVWFLIHIYINRQVYQKWVPSTDKSLSQGFTWIYCLGHVGVQDNEWVDQRVLVTGTLKADKGEIFELLIFVDNNRWNNRFKDSWVWFKFNSSHEWCMRWHPTYLQQNVSGTISIYTFQHLLNEMVHLWDCLKGYYVDS